MRFLIALAGLMLVGTPAVAGTLTVVVKNLAGQPVKDAVVTVTSAAAAAHGPIKFSWPMRMAQEHIQFDPFVLIVPVGTDVAFPNRDAVRHHVYSFSPTKRFEIKLYGKDETRSIHFDKPGVVALGCNIHDSMAGFIKVVDTPWAAKTDATGVAELADVPDGAAVVHVWHPYMKGSSDDLTRPVTLSAQGEAREAVVLDVAVKAPGMH